MNLLRHSIVFLPPAPKCLTPPNFCSILATQRTAKGENHMPAKPLHFQRIVNALPSDVYHAFTNTTALREWFCDAAQADPRKGGRVYLWRSTDYYTSGEYTALTP